MSAIPLLALKEGQHGMVVRVMNAVPRMASWLNFGIAVHFLCDSEQATSPVCASVFLTFIMVVITVSCGFNDD